MHVYAYKMEQLNLKDQKTFLSLGSLELDATYNRDPTDTLLAVAHMSSRPRLREALYKSGEAELHVD